MKLLAIISVGSIIIDLLLITFSTFSRYQRKKWEYDGMVHQLFIDFKKAYDSVKREVLYNILLEFGVPKKLVRLIKMCLNETYSKVHVGKLLLINSYSEWAETRRCSITIAFQFCFRICHQESPRESDRFGVEWNTSAIGLCR
jgi:hypothetical protein